MTVIEDVHEDHGATFTEVGSTADGARNDGARQGGERGEDIEGSEDSDTHRVVANYGRPERAHRAVRNVVGAIEMGYGVVTVEGDDRYGFVNDAVSNRVPESDGEGCYALLCDPDGRIETDMSVYNAGERLLLFTPPGEAGPLVEDWRGKVFIEDVELTLATDDFAVFGVHGPSATEKIASVGPGGAPEGALSFVRGEIGDVGATVIRTDAPAGEEGYEVVCAAEDAADVFDTLVNRGLNAAPFGYDTWETLTLEAGTPLFESELDGRIPNAAGVRNALDFEKGCFVGQEVVSRIENRGRPPERLVGLAVDEVPDAGAAVMAGDTSVGEVTRAVVSPMLEEPIAFASVDYGLSEDALSVRVDGEDVGAAVVDLPFVDGSEQSARIPTYP